MKRKRLKDKRKIQHPNSVRAIQKSYEIRRNSGGVVNHRYREFMKENPDLDPSKIPPYKPPRNGQPPVIADPAVRERILECVRAGNFPSTAARIAGVGYTTYRYWLGYGQAGVNRLYYDFWQEVRKAEAEAEANRLAEVTAQIPKDWRAGMEILGRRWPERWAKRDVNYTKIKMEGEVNHNVRSDFAKKVIDDPQSREAARALIERLPVLIQGAATPVQDEDMEFSEDE